MEGERIPVAIGDRVIISHWKSKWFYGDRVLSEGQFDLTIIEVHCIDLYARSDCTCSLYHALF